MRLYNSRLSLTSEIRFPPSDDIIQSSTNTEKIRVRALSFAIQDVEIISSTKGLSTGQQDELDTIASTCRSTLTDIEKKIDKYTELEGSQDTKRKIAKRIWKRLTWEPNDINELRSRIRNNVALLNAFYGKTSQNNVSKLLQHQENQDREKILHWLSPTNYAARYSDFIRRRQKDTGKWLLESSEFQKWIMGPKRTLFCPGMPGAGKTILSSIVIEKLYKEYENDMDVRVAYVYCNFQLQKEQTLEHFLESILKQFAKGHGSLPHSVEALYNQHQHKGTRPTADELSKALHSICAFGIFTTSFIVIDALDECQSSCGTRSRLIDEIFKLQKKHNVNILVTSRFIPEITDRFDGTAQLEIRASQEDVMRYLRGNLSLLPSCVTRSPDLQDEICVNIASAVSGM